MKTKFAMLLPIAALALATLAAGTELLEIQSPKETPQSIFVTSDKGLVAEIRLIKPGSIKIQEGQIRVAMHPGGRKAYNINGGSSLEIVADGKSALKLSADSFTIQNQDAK
jgi:hypothetical protein